MSIERRIAASEETKGARQVIEKMSRRMGFDENMGNHTRLSLKLDIV